MTVRLPSEEDLRSRLVLPFLEALGVGPDRIRTEKSFTLRLGHHAIIKGEAKQSARGRLDVLVTNHEGQPLFVAELKQEDLSLTDDDRDQGISYARLLTPMAPFVLLTNGREARIFDTVTTLEVGAEKVSERWAGWCSGRVLASGEDLRLRHEALAHFISYSADNLLQFLEAQRRTRMEALRGAPGTLAKKYLPDTYVRRTAINEVVPAFLTASRPVFVLTGPSGTGKTNEMCSLAERLSEDHPVLFLNGSELSGSLPGSIADEFNWHFSQQLDTPALCRRLSEFADRVRKPFIIIVDAIDESGLSEAPRAFGDFASHLARFDGRIRLVVSLKTTEWPRFARLGGNESPLARATFRPADSRSSSDREVGPSLPHPTCELLRFTDHERAAALTRYQEAFGFTETDDSDLLAATDDPFLLRMMAETYSDRMPGSSEARGERELLRRYLRQKIEKLDDPHIRAGVWRVLVALARALRTASRLASEPTGGAVDASDAHTDSVSEDVLLNELGATALVWLDNAVHLGLTLAVSTAPGRTRWRFQYDRVRDVVLADHVLRLDERSLEDLDARLDGWARESLLHGALALEFRDRTGRDPEGLGRMIHTRMVRLLGAYEQIRSTLGELARERIPPATSGAVGIVYDWDGSGRWLIGLFAAAEGAPVVQRQVGYGVDWWEYRDRGERVEPFATVGKNGSGWRFLLVPPADRAAAWLLEHLRELVRRGGLDDRNSRVLQMEKLFAVAGTHRRELGITDVMDDDDTLAARLGFGLLPLDLTSLRRHLDARFGAEYHRNEFVREEAQRRRDQAAYEDGAGRWMSFHFESEQLAEFDRRGREDAAAGRRFPAPNIVGGNALGVMAGVVDTLIDSSPVVSEHYLPAPDLPARGRGVGMHYSDAQISRLLAEFFGHLYREHLAVARATFGSLTETLPRVQRAPVDVVVRYSTRTADTADECDIAVLYAWVQSDDQMGGSVDCGHAYTGDPVCDGWGNLRLLPTRWGPRASVGGRSGTSLEFLLSPRRDCPLEWRGSSGAESHRLPLRSMIHRWVREDLESIGADVLIRTAGLAAGIPASD